MQAPARWQRRVAPSFCVRQEGMLTQAAIALCCRHSYHLQCVMQWAQRSRECPLCFQTLQLKVRPRGVGLLAS